MLVRPIALFTLLCATPCFSLGQEAQPILADCEKEMYVIAQARNAQQMHELLIDRNKRMMRVLDELAKATSNKEKAPGITIENNTITIEVTKTQNRAFLNITSLIDPIIFEILSDRADAVLRLKDHGMSQADRDTLLALVPTDFDVNQWQHEEVTRLIGASPRFGRLLGAPFAQVNERDDQELSAFLAFQREINETASRNQFVHFMAPLSPRGRLIVLQLGYQRLGDVHLSGQIDDSVTARDVSDYRALLTHQSQRNTP